MFTGVGSRVIKCVAGLASACIFVGHAIAMESMPVRVVEVQSALRITVEATVGGLPTTIPLQLEGIRLIGPPDHALTKLKELCPPGCEVMIEVSGPRLEADAFGMAKGWILRDYTGPVDPGSPPPPSAEQGARHRTSLQIEMIRAGWAVPDESPHRPLPRHHLMEARKAVLEAQQRRMGAYSLPGFQAPLDGAAERESGLPPLEFVPPQSGGAPAPVPNGTANGF